MIPVLFILQIPISCKGTDILTIPTFDIHMAADLNGNISAVRIIDQILEGNDHITPHILIDAVITVRNRNETDPQHREYLFNVPSGLDIVPSKTGKILHNDAIDLACSDIRKHSLEFRSFKIDTTETVIRIGIDDLDLRVRLQIVHDQFILIGDTVADGLSPISHITIFSGKPQIHGCLKCFFIHLLFLRST